ncbi:hypothetical protein BDF20DRAFT_902270 [Mycotypha africana]|uniref:uncharacterized protein n=1 Tax=Mycotypha africana TaxID=64632 RepID=UPI0023003214|nr:uncharacterized protein BDF20DRAFT_902270 [Mycotypha africana]KAI8967194.1 hypothetical protein BDF20DRAFT_902270 [Mycotypha africana]
MVTKACGLPQFMSLAFFRAMDMLNDNRNDNLSFEEFKNGWNILTRDCAHMDENNDLEELIFIILKKPNCNYMTPDDIYPLLEDIVSSHPSLQFLRDNMTFEDRYIETVICRIFYDAHCLNGKLSLKNFRKSQFPSILLNLTPTMDLYTVDNVLSYQQFYVLYYKLWALDTDHDLAISETDLYNYNMGTLSSLSVKRIMDIGRVFVFDNPACNHVSSNHDQQQKTLSYFDFIWFLLSEVDKSTPMAIEYWFRCLDMDNDGVITSYELSQFWHDQDIKQQQFCDNMTPDDDYIHFDDIMRQMNDLIQPRIPGQFDLRDLKKNGFLAERFFDTFINFDRLRVHDSRQEGSVRQKEAYLANLMKDRGLPNSFEPTILSDDLGFPVLCNWSDYASIEYQRIIVDESYVNSYEEEEEDLSDQHYSTTIEQPNYYCSDHGVDNAKYANNDDDDSVADNNSDDYPTSLSSSPTLSGSDSNDDKLIPNDIVTAAFTNMSLSSATTISCRPSSSEQQLVTDNDEYITAHITTKVPLTNV